jgi:hypothetical protein
MLFYRLALAGRQVMFLVIQNPVFKFFTCHRSPKDGVGQGLETGQAGNG